MSILEPDFPGGQIFHDTHFTTAAGEQDPAAPAMSSSPTAANVDTPGLPDTDSPTRAKLVTKPISAPPGSAAQTPQAPARKHSAPISCAPGLADPLLALLADVLDDLERTRIANENRLRQLTRTEEDKDGETRGLGLTTDDPSVARIHTVVHGLSELEHAAELNLARQLRTHPLGAWIKRTPGIGEKQGARLLAAIGDPYWNTLHNRPRTVSELWAYCGLHVLPAGQAAPGTHPPTAGGSKLHPGQDHADTQIMYAGVSKPGDPDQTRSDAQTIRVGVAPFRAKGQRANWSPTAKMRAYLIAEACMKGLRKPCARADGDDHAVHVEDCACFPYRLVYDQARIKYADATHKAECKRCGPAGKPAAVGSPLSAGHKQARALRIVSKTLLQDLWLEVHALHGNTPAGAGRP